MVDAMGVNVKRHLLKNIRDFRESESKKLHGSCKIRYKVGSSYGVHAEVLCFCLVSAGVEDGLHDGMPALEIIPLK